MAKVCSWRALRFEVRRLQGPPTLIGPPLHGVGLSLVAQLLHCYVEWHGPQTPSERNLTLSRIDQDAPISFDVCNSEVKAARDFGGSGTLDLDCPSFPAGKAKYKVKFCPSRCPVEEGFRASGCGGRPLRPREHQGAQHTVGQRPPRGFAAAVCGGRRCGDAAGAGTALEAVRSQRARTDDPCRWRQSCGSSGAAWRWRCSRRLRCYSVAPPVGQGGR